jgi:hypothetical protein
MRPVPPLTSARRLRDAFEPIAMYALGAPAVRASLRDVGLRGLEGYLWGRAAALGEPSPGVVVAAFGVFAPNFVVGAYESARSKVPRAQVLAARERGAMTALRELLPTSETLAQVGDLLLAAVESLDATGRPLFSGLRDLPSSADPHVRLWRSAELVREHRGDGHLAACIAAGLDAVEMNVLTELWLGYPVGEYSSTRGHSHAAIDAAATRLARRGWVENSMLTESGADARDAIEAATDRSQDALVVGLGDRAEWLIRAGTELASAVIASGKLFADARKLSAG